MRRVGGSVITSGRFSSSSGSGSGADCDCEDTVAAGGKRFQMEAESRDDESQLFVIKLDKDSSGYITKKRSKYAQLSLKNKQNNTQIINNNNKLC